MIYLLSNFYTESMHGKLLYGVQLIVQSNSGPVQIVTSSTISFILFQDLDVECVAILNDTVGCQIACAFSDHNCEIGVILGRMLFILMTLYPNHVIQIRFSITIKVTQSVTIVRNTCIFNTCRYWYKCMLHGTASQSRNMGWG